MSTSFRKKKIKRRARGMALISILSIGAFAMVSMLSFAYLAVILTRSEGFQKQRESLFAAAESGLEYAMYQINSSIDKGETSPLEPADGEPERVTEVPSNFISSTTSSTTPTRVFVRVKEVSASDVGTMESISNIYDPAFDPNRGPALTPTFGNVQTSLYSKSHWRVIEVTATRGQSYSSLRAVLKPTMGSSTKSTNPYLAGSILARNMTLGNSDQTTQIGTSAKIPKTADDGTAYQQYDATIMSNGLVDIAKNTTISGNLQVVFPSAGAPTSVVSMGDNSQINGQVFTSGDDLSNLGGLTANAGPNASPGDNVLANADISPTSPVRLGDNNTAPQDSSFTNTSVPSPVPNSPTSAAPLPAFPSDSPTGLSTGNYVSPGITTDGVTQPLVVSGPIQIFIEGSSSLSDAINLNSQYLQNSGSPSNLKLWYNGTKPVNISIPAGKQFNAIVYAPNSNVTISGDGTFSGAVTADTLTAQPSSFNMMGATDLQNALGTRPQAGGGEPPTGRYQVMSWQQVRSRLVSAP